MSLLNLMLKMIIIPVYQNESNEAYNDVDDHNSYHWSLAMRAMMMMMMMMLMIIIHLTDLWQ